MPDRRQAFAREPIEVDLGGKVILVGPIPWEQRNDFGNEVMRQHTEIMNHAIQIYIDDAAEDAIPKIETLFAEKFNDPRRLMELGLPEETFDEVRTLKLYNNQVVAILLAICDVNELSQLYPLLDPNSPTPTILGGNDSTTEAAGIDTQKTESGPDSSPPALTGPLSAV